MITFLEGELIEKTPSRAVVNVGGVGYEVFISLNGYDRLPAEGRQVRLLTYHHIREDIQALYGFVDEEERELFIKMLGVSGIGPKLALGVISGMPSRDLRAAVIEGDVKRLSSISGVGKKTAERLVVELRDTFSKGEALEAVSESKTMKPEDLRSRDAIMALISLGYKQAEAQKMVEQVSKKLTGKEQVEDVVRLALTK